MPLERIRVSDVVPAKPEDVFKAWLDADLHGQMTGSKATCDARIGGEFTAWDGYIAGRTLVIEPHARIVQTWRTTEFKEDDGDSHLEVLLEEDPDGTKVTFVHSNLPEGSGAQYEEGWQKHYLDPMIAHFRG